MTVLAALIMVRTITAAGVAAMSIEGYTVLQEDSAPSAAASISFVYHRFPRTYAADNIIPSCFCPAISSEAQAHGAVETRASEQSRLTA